MSLTACAYGPIRLQGNDVLLSLKALAEAKLWYLCVWPGAWHRWHLLWICSKTGGQWFTMDQSWQWTVSPTAFIIADLAHNCRVGLLCYSYRLGFCLQECFFSPCSVVCRVSVLCCFGAFWKPPVGLEPARKKPTKSLQHALQQTSTSVELHRQVACTAACFLHPAQNRTQVGINLLMF